MQALAQSSDNLPLFWDQVVSSLSMADQMSQVSAVVVQAARDIAGADGATFVLREGDMCHYFDEVAISPLWKGSRFSTNICISGWVMENRKIATIKDIYTDSRIPFNAYKPTFVKSLCMMPVRENDPIAAIGCYWKNIYTPTEFQISSLQTLANLTATSIQKVQIKENFQKELMRTKDLSEKNKDLELSIYSMAHDLRNPLNTLTFVLSVMDSPISKETSLNALKSARTTTKRMADQISKILSLNRMSTGAVNKELIHMDALFNEICQHISIQYPGKPVEVKTSGDMKAFADRSLMQIVLENLISNSFKFFKKESGTLRLVSQETENEKIFCLEDNGLGFENSKASQLFKPLSRLHKDVPGTGLGLASAAKIISVHGGRMWAEAKPSVGAKFYFSLPAVDKTWLVENAK